MADYVLTSIDADVYPLDKVSPDHLGCVYYKLMDRESGNHVMFGANVVSDFDEDVNMNYVAIEIPPCSELPELSIFLKHEKERLIMLGLQAFHDEEDAHPEIIKTYDEDY